MAHLRPIIIRKCDEYGCNSRATESLYGIRNAPYGDFCTKHAGRRLRELEARERADLARGIEPVTH